MEIYRQEHPNPQWERKNWINLNGEWEFDFDFGKTARERKLYEADSLPQKINVPFCPESELSGIGYKDFISGVCYRKAFNLTEKTGRVILHFGAVDFRSYLYVNKQYVGRHIGGYSSFEFDITDYVTEGENVIFLAVEDDLRSPEQYMGKQSDRFESYACSYTRTTGIWQTVWLEFVPESYIKSAKYYPDIDAQSLMITGEVCGKGEIKATAYSDGKNAGGASASTTGGRFMLSVKLDTLKFWEVGKGGLYDLTLEFGNDTVNSYFGMRSVELDGYKFLINGKSVFQRLVLDQGFYPDGIYTAKNEEALINDIQISLDAGFNGARLHEKVFEPRFLYHCDRLGYIVWGEQANWGMDYKNISAEENFINEWIEVVNRDFNHPAIVGWCPHNETWGYEEDTVNGRNRLLETVYNITKALDNTRPCIDTSGNYHAKTDIYDIHCYEQNVEIFANAVNVLNEKGVMSEFTTTPELCKRDYKGGITFISEYGGIKWSDKDGWGYGDAPKTEKEFIERYKGLTEALLNSPKMFGFCYTQLYDVEQEQNGLYTYERKAKFDMDIFKKINSGKAAIED